MATPRVGPTGVADAVGDIYVVDSAGDLTRLNKGSDEQVLISKAGALNDLGETVDLEWASIDELSRENVEGDSTDAIFKKIDTTSAGQAGTQSNPSTKTRGTHSVLEYSQGAIEGLAWQKTMGPNYSGDDLTLSVYWVLNDPGAPVGTDVVFQAAIERNEPGHVITADAFDTLQAVVVAGVAAGADGEIVKTTITFTQTEADGITAGDPFRLYLQRTGTAIEDDLIAPVQLVRWDLEEDV